MYPFTQLSPPDDTDYLSHGSSICMEYDFTGKNSKNDVSKASALVSDLSTSNDSKISNKSSSGSSILFHDLNKYIHYGMAMKLYETNKSDFFKDNIDAAKKNTVKMICVSVLNFYPDMLSQFEIISDYQCGDNRYIESMKWSGLLNCYLMVQKISHRLSQQFLI